MAAVIPSATSREVQRYFLLLLLVMAAAAGLLVGVLGLQYAAESEERERVDRFHVQTLLLTQGAVARALRLEDQLGQTGGARNPRSDGGRQIQLDLYGLEVALGSIEKLQGTFGSAATRGSAERAQASFTTITALLTVDGPVGELAQLRAQAAALRVALTQLQRLHSIAVSEALEELADLSRVRDLWIFGIVSAISLGALAVTIGILRLLRSTLDRHAALEQELLEQERRQQQGRKMEALGTLVGGVAHDFNNLLTAILGNAEVLLASAPPGSTSESGLREIQKAGDTAAGLTRQLLTFSRPEIARPQLVSLHEMLDGIEPLLRHLLREDIQLDIAHADEPCVVRMDPVQLEQVLINLVANAGDAMPGGGTLTLASACLEVAADAADAPPDLPAGRYARLTVEDSGHGMSAETRERIFEPFFTTKAPGEGTGLGLSTVHGIVAKGNGSIRVRSTLGSGTRVDVYLPSCEAAPDRPEELDAPAPRGGRETILLAEDTDSVRKVTARGLARAGYQVLEAEDGAQALRALREHGGEVHLLLTDVVMPNMGGPELAQAVRALRPGMPVVFLSGYSEEMVKGEGRNPEMVMIAKPFTMGDLLQVLRRELEASGAKPEAPRR